MPADHQDRRRRGVLVDWNDDRGFGFIAPAAGGPQVFVHVSAFPRGRRPVAGAEVTYVEVRDERNRAQASEVRQSGAASNGVRLGGGVPVALALATAFFAFLVVLFLTDELPVTLVAAYGLLSAVTFGMYGADKSAAVRGTWRTAESTLHTLALVGGWPGALVARKVFRHKTSKQPFRTIFWLTVIANCGLLGWYLHAAPVTLP